MIRVIYLAGVLRRTTATTPTPVPRRRPLKWPTINRGARAIEWTNESAFLETGKKADVIVITMKRPEWYPLYSEVQNLVYSASGDSVETVFIDGKIVMEDREVKTVNEEEILERCQECAVGILKRSGVEVPGKWPIL